MAGYSGTPLPQKLGIKPESRVGVANPPQGFERALGKLDPGVKLYDVTKGGTFDVLVVFVRSEAELARVLPARKKNLEPSGGLWIGWPKKSSGIETDVTEDVVRRHALALGLVDNKVCAIDDTWSGLRLVYRLVDRPKPAAKKKLAKTRAKSR